VDRTSNGCPLSIRSKNPEADPTFSKGGAQGKSQMSQNMARPRLVRNLVSGHQFASFASPALDGNHELLKRIKRWWLTSGLQLPPIPTRVRWKQGDPLFPLIGIDGNKRPACFHA
jgi:hypothetical protein